MCPWWPPKLQWRRPIPADDQGHLRRGFRIADRRDGAAGDERLAEPPGKACHCRELSRWWRHDRCREFARAAPDGHTLLCGAIGNVFASKVIGRDPAKDFIPVATVARIAWVVVVRPELSATSLGQLIDHAKANPGKLNWGFGQGTAPHMFGELFMAATGIDVAKIPYKSGTQAVPDMLGGRIDINIGTLSNLLPLIRDGKLRAIAITSEARSPDLPDVPTMAESGFPQLTRGDWTGFWAPAGTPPDYREEAQPRDQCRLDDTRDEGRDEEAWFRAKCGITAGVCAFIIDEMDAWTPAAKAADILPK